MRNKQRIYPFTYKLTQYWLKNPDLRFGQIVSIIGNQLGNGRDIFYAEEKELGKILDKLIKK